MSKVSDEDVPDIKTGLLRKPAGRLGVVSPCERSENKEGVWGGGWLT